MSTVADVRIPAGDTTQATAELRHAATPRRQAAATVSGAPESRAAFATSLRAVSPYVLLSAVGLLLGFTRELVVASTFGLSRELDVFVAVTGVYLFFGVQVGNALETVFVSQAGRERTTESVRASLVGPLQGLLLVNVLIVVGLLLTSGVLLRAVFPAFSQAQHDLGIRTVALLLLPIMLANTAGLVRGGLSVMGTFGPAFAAGSVISVCSILSMVLFAHRIGIDALSLGLALGNLVVLGWFVVPFAKQGVCVVSAKPVLSRPSRFVLWGAAAGVLLAEGLYQAVVMTERSFASSLPAGTLAAFFYAGAFIAVPASLLVMPLTATLYPRLVETFARDRQEGTRLVVRHGVLLFGVGLALAVGVSALAEPMVQASFVRGNFSGRDAQVTAAILSITVFALPFLSLERLVRNALYAVSDYRSPACGLGCQWAVLLILGTALVLPYGAAGLAVSAVSAEAANVLLISVLLRRRLRPAERA
jgi:peptidoglycan biosynthesis protein MviN/MurJ (putative lipid II flippase)